MRMIPQTAAVARAHNTLTQEPKSQVQEVNPAILSKAWDLLTEAREFRARFEAIVAKQELATSAYDVTLSWIEDEVRYFEMYALFTYQRAIKGLHPGPKPRLIYGHVG